MGLLRQRWSIAAAWLLVGGLTSWSAVKALTADYNQCDNIAGTCLRMRQIAAINAVQATSVVLAIVCIAAGLSSFRRRLPEVVYIGLPIALAFAVGYLVLEPIHELNNRWTGWLGD